MYKRLLIAGVWLTIGGACTAQTALSPEAFEQKLNSTSNKIVVDVRTVDEFNQGHLPNAILIDYYKEDFKQQLSKLDKNKTLFVYCAAGGRSADAARQLMDLGFKNVIDLEGGMGAWKTAGKKIIKP
ncbi:MAG: rhodanese-like domain-containing protein [Flammeovirgaceae bacterium]|nr:rhodanese-like domain-containing protein [Flammeovirgaceae bacterium]